MQNDLNQIEERIFTQADNELISKIHDEVSLLPQYNEILVDFDALRSLLKKSTQEKLNISAYDLIKLIRESAFIIFQNNYRQHALRNFVDQLNNAKELIKYAEHFNKVTKS